MLKRTNLSKINLREKQINLAKEKINSAKKMAQMLMQTIQKADQNLVRKNLLKVAIKLNLAKKEHLNLIKKPIENLAKSHHRNLTRNLKQTIKTWQI